MIALAITVGEISAKPNQMTSLDQQMTAKVKASKNAPAQLDPMIEPASGAKVQIIKDDAAEKEEVKVKGNILRFYKDDDHKHTLFLYKNQQL